MDKERIEQIRRLGDRLASYILHSGDGKLLLNFRTQNYGEFRTLLLRANRKEVLAGRPPVVAFDPYVAVFEIAEEAAYTQWRLARDLVLIRLVEQLHAMKWSGFASQEIQKALDSNEDEQDTDERETTQV